ncbi:hypothetical protein GN956_G14230 [Arapaima gigas]
MSLCLRQRYDPDERQEPPFSPPWVRLTERPMYFQPTTNPAVDSHFHGNVGESKGCSYALMTAERRRHEEQLSG